MRGSNRILIHRLSAIFNADRIKFINFIEHKGLINRNNIIIYIYNVLRRHSHCG
jgi:hypothetical protein